MFIQVSRLTLEPSFRNIMSRAFLEPIRNGRLSSPLRNITPLFSEHGNPQSISITSPLPLGHSMPPSNANTDFTTHSLGIALERSPDLSKECGKQPMDYTDLEGNASFDLIPIDWWPCFDLVLTKVQLESKEGRYDLPPTSDFSTQICVKRNDKLLYPNVSVCSLICARRSISGRSLPWQLSVLSFSQWS